MGKRRGRIGRIDKRGERRCGERKRERERERERWRQVREPRYYVS